MKVFGIAGWSGAGKTCLIEAVLPILRARGLKVSVLKHAHCVVENDVIGKDSWRHREAGAHEVMLVSRGRWVLTRQWGEEDEPAMHQVLAAFGECDLLLVESYKYWPIPKIEVHRPALGKPLMLDELPQVIAVASDEPLATAQVGGREVFALNDAASIAQRICTELGL